MPALFALLSSLLWGTADFLGGVATRRLPGPSVVVVSQLIALIALVPVAVLTGSFDTPTTYVVPGVLAGLVGTAAIGAFYEALATGTMGIVAPVAALGVVLPVKRFRYRRNVFRFDEIARHRRVHFECLSCISKS